MTTIVTKNGSGAPLASDLVQGELAVDLTNKRLYTEDSGGSVIELGSNPTSLTTGTFTSTGIDDNATSTAITIDSSQRIGIGTASPDAGSQLSLFSTLYPSLFLNNNSTTGGGAIRFAKEGTQHGLIASSGWILADTSSDISLQAGTGLGLRFYTNGNNERMRINSSGNVGIGTTAPAQLLDVSGTAIFGGSTTRLTTYSDSTYSGIFNGSSLTSDEAVYMGGDSIFFYGGGTERMRILSSGGITFNGDTAAANALDDYEEGTWTPTITDATNNATMGASNFGRYTKIGRLVVCQMYVETTSLGSIAAPAATYVSGWPFSIGSTGGAVASQASGLAIGADQSLTLSPWSSTLMRLAKWDATTGTSNLVASEWSADGAMYITISYEV